MRLRYAGLREGTILVAHQPISCSYPKDTVVIDAQRHGRVIVNSGKRRGVGPPVNGTESHTVEPNEPSLGAEPEVPVWASCDPVDCLVRHSVRSRPTIVLIPVSYTHLRAHETPEHLVCRL